MALHAPAAAALVLKLNLELHLGVQYELFTHGALGSDARCSPSAVGQAGLTDLDGRSGLLA
jgi:hypothetical protein